MGKFKLKEDSRQQVSVLTFEAHCLGYVSQSFIQAWPSALPRDWDQTIFKKKKKKKKKLPIFHINVFIAILQISWS